MKRRGSFGLYLMATLGVAVMLSGIAIHWYFESRGQPHRLEWLPQLVGASIAFAAFYAMDDKKAQGAGGFLVNAGIRILTVIRTGSGEKDPVITVEKTTAANDPEALPEVKVTVEPVPDPPLPGTSPPTPPPEKPDGV